uniref:Hexosyltransferase n=1 Tax=Opuntia streptacantha TaxID=393608 RepID=A0A7C9ES90_OPUST
MKLKIGLRKPVLFLLFVTVLAPILLYTDNLASFSSSSPQADFVQDIPTFTFTGDTRQLNLLPQETETSKPLKEPVGIVYSEGVANSSDKDDSPKIRQLQDVSQPVPKVDSMDENKASRVLSMTGIGNNNFTGSGDENPIRQITDRGGAEIQSDNLQKPMVQMGADKMDPKRGQKPVISDNTPHIDMKREKPSLRKSHNVNVRESVTTEGKTENNDDRKGMGNAMVLYLKDQLIRAKVYLSLTATRSNAHFIRELRQRIKETQRALGDATKDLELPRNAIEKSKAMDQTLARGQQIQDDCATIVKKLRAMLHSTEEQLKVHRKQAMFLTQLTAKTLPKGLHCLPLRLSTEYYTSNYSVRQFANQEKLDNPQLYHYAIFSDNVLATAVAVNSTVSHAKDPSSQVFHIVTDRLNYAAMRMWFLANPPGKATIEVQNVEDFTWLNSSYSPVLKQLGSPSMRDYYFKIHRAAADSNLKFRNPKYLSILNHLRFYLPQIFPKLKKVVFLDDDIVVQKDLTGLWSIDLKGNVNGAVETCGESFHRFDRYLNFSHPLISKNFDPRACGWAYGMNVFDLNEWKRQNITEVYHTWQKLNHDRQLWKLGTLPPGLITFWKRTYPIDRSWHVLGLGYNPNVNQKEIERAAVIHYNGNMKPWLEIGMPKYRNYWTKYVDYDQVYLRECNINP